MRFKWLLLMYLLGASLASAHQSPPPVLFFSDLAQAPASGNTDPTYSASGNGAYITLYGNFLNNLTSVELNRVSCLKVISNPAPWLWYQRMVVQLQSNCTSGTFVVITSAGASNGIPFTVVGSGKIHYVSATRGKPTNAGTFQSPWGDNGKPCAGLTKAKQTMADGDITYVEDAYSCVADDYE